MRRGARADDGGAMHTVPQGRRDAITYFETHVQKWVEHAGEIGADPALVARLADMTAAARQAFNQQYQAQQAARAATMRMNSAIAEMRRLGSAVLKEVGATAGTDGKRIYSLANVSPPRKPSPIAAPGKPH